MPLRSSKNTPIKSYSTTGEVEPGTKLLAAPYFKQEQSNWCWAACCQMVFQFDGLANIRQCDMATAQFLNHAQGTKLLGDCCSAPASGICNQGNWPENTYSHYGFLYVKHGTAVSYSDLMTEIDAGRQLEIYSKWDAGNSHVAMIRGYYENGDLEVSDPWYGPGLRTFDFVTAAYGFGAWTMTYTGIAR